MGPPGTVPPLATGVPDASWSAWTPVANGGTVPGGPNRYAQYRVVLVSAGGNTPVVSNLAIDLDAIPVTWYFAEGYTGPGFDEWITIQTGVSEITTPHTHKTPA